MNKYKVFLLQGAARRLVLAVEETEGSAKVSEDCRTQTLFPTGSSVSRNSPSSHRFPAPNRVLKYLFRVD